jgi:heme/copper-type cytochrome/quinol oxidase subunit 3
MTARTMQAHPAGEHEAEIALAHGQSGMPTALLGMLLFIASEVMFFGGLFAAYFNARAPRRRRSSRSCRSRCR